MKLNIKGTFADKPVNLEITIDATPDETAEQVLQFYECMINRMTKSRVNSMADKIRNMLDL
jgi:hypothetical protein